MEPNSVSRHTIKIHLTKSGKPHCVKEAPTHSHIVYYICRYKIQFYSTPTGDIKSSISGTQNPSAQQVVHLSCDSVCFYRIAWVVGESPGHCSDISRAGPRKERYL